MQPHPPAPDCGPVVDEQPQLITRFSIVLMAFTLMGMGIGSALPPKFGALTLHTGFVGIIAYGAFELVAVRRRREVIDVVRSRSEDRLSKHVYQLGREVNVAEPDAETPNR
ncbi:MAG: hypothetical protein KF861_15600 [Planctomycetaceae bacterium]|nr:hypothetical protein [Planctomycetaceae bacterium]